MSRTKPRIQSSKSKADSIGLLTAGLVIVFRSTRYVLVEDEADVEFYGAVRDILSDYGPSKDSKALAPSPSLVFLPASLGAGKNKIGGGKGAVMQWVNKFDAAPLDQVFRGIIDKDTTNVSTKRVHIVGRYNIENYLLDPFVIFGILLEEETAPAIQTVSISQGDEHLIRAMSEPELQSIVTAIQLQVEPQLLGLTTVEKESLTVSFTNGKSVQYPAWMIDRNGHDLLPIYQNIFGGAKVISPPRLEKSFRRIRLMPVELAEIMQKLQD